MGLKQKLINGFFFHHQVQKYNYKLYNLYNCTKHQKHSQNLFIFSFFQNSVKFLVHCLREKNY